MIVETDVPDTASPDFDLPNLSGLCASLAIADVTGDGNLDVVMGVPDEPPGGAIHVAPGPNFAAESSWYGGAAGASMGAAIAGVGDVNGDGTDDVVAAGYASAVLLVSSSGAFAEGWRFDAQVLSSQLGLSLAAADLDDDSRKELVVGEPDWRSASPGVFGDGRVLVFRGIDGGFEDTAWWTVEGVTNDRLGFSLALGDLDDDGALDLVAGAPSENGSPHFAVHRGMPPAGPRADAGAPGVATAGEPFVPGASFADTVARRTYTCEWDWDGDGLYEESIPSCTFPAVPHTFESPGRRFVRLRVEDAEDGRAGESVTLIDVR